MKNIAHTLTTVSTSRTCVFACSSHSSSFTSLCFLFPFHTLMFFFFLSFLAPRSFSHRVKNNNKRFLFFVPLCFACVLNAMNNKTKNQQQDCLRNSMEYKNFEQQTRFFSVKFWGIEEDMGCSLGSYMASSSRELGIFIFFFKFSITLSFKMQFSFKITFSFEVQSDSQH